MKSKHLLWLFALLLMVSFSSVTFAQEKEKPQKPAQEKQEFNRPPHGGNGEAPPSCGDRPDGRPEGKEGCHGKGPAPFIPDLTKEQQASLKKLHLKSEKEILPIQNQIGELEAHLRTLTSDDNADIAQIDPIVDQIAGLRAKIEKIHIKERLDTRKLLTEEQRLEFDRQPALLPPPPPQNQ
jgi:Spy/CpxP family protein refolding chaperone